MKKLSIIIVTYNSEKDIYDCLKSIYDNSDLSQNELEIIVVDNNSNHADKMFACIHNIYGGNVITIKNSVNGGYGQGNNVGIHQATAPIILIMNPDVRLLSPSFKSICHQFKNNSQLSIIGMKQLLDDGRESNNSFNCTSMTNGYLSTIITALCNRKNIYIPKLMYFSGSCFYIRKSMFEAIGLFDENIFMYGEESDIHHRMIEKFGAHFLYQKEICYKHLTLERPLDLKTEDKILNSLIYVNEKFRYPKKKTIRNKIQAINLLIWRERIKKMLFLPYEQEKVRLWLKTRHHLQDILKNS